MPSELTKSEQDELARQEKIVDSGLGSFVDVGTALMKIRDEKLHRTVNENFKDYVATRFGIGGAYAFRLIQSAEIVQKSPIGDSIPNEAVARELKKVPPEQHRATMREAKKIAGNITAESVGMAKLMADLPTQTQAKVMRQATKDGEISVAALKQAAAKIAPKPKPAKSGAEVVPVKLRKVAESLYGKLLRCMDKMGVSKKVDKQLDDILKAIRGK